jgi:hypothetical protein
MNTLLGVVHGLAHALEAAADAVAEHPRVALLVWALTFLAAAIWL